MTLIQHLSVIQETRSHINQKHDLIDVMFLVISAIMAGAEGWQDIETYGQNKSEWLKLFRPFENGIPKRHTIARILKGLKPDTLLEALMNWANENRKSQGKPLIALDGKVLRGAYRGNPQSALQLVTAYDTENGLVLSQKATATKTSEITTVRDMLSVLNIQGAVVTVDALHCQRETLEQISEQKGHVVVQVKGNQGQLKKAIEQQFNEYFNKPKATPVIELKEKGHGRIEERNVFQLKAKLPPELSAKWPTIRSLIAVERLRTIKGKTTIDTSFYVSSLSPKHKSLHHYIRQHIRQHWRIENSQHYILDVVFNEDKSRIVMDDAVEHMALFKRFVMNILRQCDDDSPSQRQKLKKATWSDDYRAKLFFG